MPYVFSREEYRRQIGWYTQARFGLFLHRGLYAIPARGEWVRSDGPELAFAGLDPDPVLPDGTDTVLEIRLRQEEGDRP